MSISEQHGQDAAWFDPEATSVVVAGDNLAASAHLPDGAFTLVYLDPPFNTGKIQRREHFTSAYLPDAGGEGQAGDAGGAPRRERG